MGPDGWAAGLDWQHATISDPIWVATATGDMLEWQVGQVTLRLTKMQARYWGSVLINRSMEEKG